jgi:hypothetical protein
MMPPCMSSPAARRSPGGGRLRGNWVIRVHAAGPAEVAWVAARAAQGRGHASQAAASLVAGPRQAGWTVTADIHPGRHASQRVARAARLVPAAGTCDGETRWVSPPPAAP